MEFLSGLSPFVTEREPLSAHTCLGVGGEARWFARPRTKAELSEVIHRCAEAGVDWYPLGLGANLLVCDDGVDGMVIRLGASPFRQIDWEAVDRLEDGARFGDEVCVPVSAGVDLRRLVMEAVRRGLTGLEQLAGIPGTLGGVIRMNAGGRYGQIADVVRNVDVIDSSGRSRTLAASQIGFRYRGTDLGSSVIVGATLVLRRGDPDRIRDRYMAILDEKKRTQPMAATAGCVFKNPPGQSAGLLIDQAGLKNHQVGGAYVSNQHANFIVVDEGATARDVFQLIGQVRGEVAARFGVELELEVQVWGHRHAPSADLIA